MKGHDLKHLEGSIRNLQQSLTQLSDEGDTEELLRIIHNPGWTTLAESLFVLGLVESLHQQAGVMNAQKQALMAGSRAVGAQEGG